MAKLGPKYTGNPAHSQFVEFLAGKLQSYGLDVVRDHYTLPRWDAKRWEITVHPVSGSAYRAPVTSYYPYSGQTSAAGVTGELVYLGTFDSLGLAPQRNSGRRRNQDAPSTQPVVLPKDVRGKIVFVECPVFAHPYREWFKVWGSNPSDLNFPESFRRTVWGTVGLLTEFQKAGALGVILGWTDISDANAADQYCPFSRPLQNIPGLWVGRETSKKLRSVADSGAKATLVLEAEVVPDTPTDTLFATLPGTTPDELIIINSHTDGPNATEENGGLGVIALAKYFTQIPKSDRKRSLVFVLTTGHFAGPYVPSIRGFVAKHPEIIKKTVAALTIEHLGARDWSDDVSLKYKPTGEDELALAISPFQSTADLMIENLKGSTDRHVAVVNPAQGQFHGEGGGLYAAGVPVVGYITVPNYLLAGPRNGCIEKLSSERIHAEIELFAKVVHKMDIMTAPQLRGKA
jgi:hypothetical protein